MLSRGECLHADLVLVVDVQQARDNGGDVTRWGGLSMDPRSMSISKQYDAGDNGGTVNAQSDSPTAYSIEKPRGASLRRDRLPGTVRRCSSRSTLPWSNLPPEGRAKRHSVVLWASTSRRHLNTHSRRTDLANPLGIIEQTDVDIQPSRKVHRAGRVLLSGRIAIQRSAEMVKCRRANCGVPIPILPQLQRILLFS